MKKIVVLISGQGSNLQALINACVTKQINAKIVATFSDKPQAYGLKYAKLAGIATHTLDAKSYQDREVFDTALSNIIDQYSPILLVLAGYMRILSPSFVQRYNGRIINIHPSLLPKYPGLYTHRQAIKNGDHEHGTSVHFVSQSIDKGPLIIQGKVPILSSDEENTLMVRVKAQEHILYPLVVNWFLTGRLVMRENSAWLDGQLLPESQVYF